MEALGLAGLVCHADWQTKRALAAGLLAPLAPEPELLTTLAAFLRMDLAPSLAAQKLNIHLDRARGPQLAARARRVRQTSFG